MIKQYQATLKTHGGTSKIGRLGGKCLSKTSNLSVADILYVFNFEAAVVCRISTVFPYIFSSPVLRHVVRNHSANHSVPLPAPTFAAFL